MEKSRVIEVTNFHGNQENSLRKIFKSYGSIASIVYIKEFHKAYITFFTSLSVDLALQENQIWVVNKETMIASRPQEYFQLKHELGSELQVLLQSTPSNSSLPSNSSVPSNSSIPSQSIQSSEEKKLSKKEKFEAKKAAKKAKLESNRKETESQNTQSLKEEAPKVEEQAEEESKPQNNKKLNVKSKQEKRGKNQKAKKEKRSRNASDENANEVVTEQVPSEAQAQSENSKVKKEKNQQYTITEEEFERTVTISGPFQLIKNNSEVNNFFQEFGTVVRFIPKFNFSFVVLESAEKANEAVKGLNDFKYKDYPKLVKVRLAQKKGTQES